MCMIYLMTINAKKTPYIYVVEGRLKVWGCDRLWHTRDRESHLLSVTDLFNNQVHFGAILNHIGTPCPLFMSFEYSCLPIPRMKSIMVFSIFRHEEPQTPQIYNALRRNFSQLLSSPINSYNMACTQPQASTIEVCLQHKLNDRARLTVCLAPLSNACLLNFLLIGGKDHHFQLQGKAADRREGNECTQCENESKRQENESKWQENESKWQEHESKWQEDESEWRDD